MLVLLALLAKAALRAVELPPLLGYLILGLGLRIVDTRWGVLGEPGLEVLEFLGMVGVFVLLFRAGLESDLKGLLAQLRRAWYIWFATVVFSGGLAFYAGWALLDLGFLPSLFLAVALTATSVGVSIAPWQDREALCTDDGELLLDVAEMDDISGVVLMALLFAVAPQLEGGLEEGLGLRLGLTALRVLVTFALFAGLCFLFSRYVEPRLTRLFERICPRPDPMLLVTGVGLVIASLAGLMGFSVAIGAFLAGLSYSRDPEAVKMEKSFNALYDLFTPFFFISIALRVNPESLSGVWGLAGVLLVVAAAGKLVGAGAPALIGGSWTTALLLGVSMIPRAEICMIVMSRGHELGDWAVSDRLYSATLIVSALTCILAPLALQALFARRPPDAQSGGAPGPRCGS